MNKFTEERHGVSRAVWRKLAPVMFCAAAALSMPVIQAAEPGAIAPGPLDAVLNRFAVEAGIELSMDVRLVQGKTSPGLEAPAADVATALRQLLQGTGLRALQSADGTWALVPVSGDGAMQLGPVRVEGQQSAVFDTQPGSSESTQRYTVDLSRSATPLAMSLRETPQSITVITRARLEDQALDEITEVLEQTVGVSVNASGALGTDGYSIFSRGFQVENYQVDGVSRPMTIYGFEENTADMAVYDRVEVVRGAAGLLTGVGNPSAAVNLVRKKPTDTLQSYVSAQIGSWDRARLEGDVSGPLTADGRVRGRLVSAYQHNESFIDREDVDKRVFYGVVEADLTPSTLLTLGAEYQRFNNHGAPRGGVPLYFSDGTRTHFARSTSVGANWSDFDQDGLSAFAELDYQLSDRWLLEADYEHARPEYDELIGYLYTADGFAQDGSGANVISARWAADMRQDTLGARLSGTFEAFGQWHDLAVGVSHAAARSISDNYAGWWSGGDYYAEIDDAYAFLETGDFAMPDLSPQGGHSGERVTEDAAYAMLRLRPLDPLSLVLGSRVTAWKYESMSQAEGGQRQWTTEMDEDGEWSPYAGAVWDLAQRWSLYASYTRIFEPQSYEDVSGTRLDPLEGANYEGGLKFELGEGRFNASASVFRIEQDNYALAVDGELTPDGTQAYEAVSGTVSTGFELEAAGEPLRGWQLGGGFSRAEPEDRDGEPLQTYVPKDSFKLFSTYRLPGELKAVTVGGNLRWQGRAYYDGAGPQDERYVQGSLVVVDLMSRWSVNDHLSMLLNVRNLTDKRYFTAFSVGGTFGAPRSLLLTARYQF